MLPWLAADSEVRHACVQGLGPALPGRQALPGQPPWAGQPLRQPAPCCWLPCTTGELPWSAALLLVRAALLYVVSMRRLPTCMLAPLAFLPAIIAHQAAGRASCRQHAVLSAWALWNTCAVCGAPQWRPQMGRVSSMAAG